MISPCRGYILGEILSEEKLLSSGLWVVPSIKKGIPPKRVKVLSIGLPTYDKKPIKVRMEGRDTIGTKWELKQRNGKLVEIPWTVKVGETLFIKKGAGIPIRDNGLKCLFLKRYDILGVEADPIRAVNDDIIVKTVFEEKNELIFLADGSKASEGDFYGDVVSVGPQNKHDIKKGDKIRFMRAGQTPEGMEIETDGQRFYRLRKEWILAKDNQGEVQ